MSGNTIGGELTSDSEGFVSASHLYYDSRGQESAPQGALQLPKRLWSKAA